ncbi:MAG: nucleotidyl transferase AbiEii/AbiGii toxin family protein [Epsilonproteobacteria bacterium]|nr:nucleotidyl transferase AbiEii/AbiGii toxin family protein [Campylobacterota bacterium]
MFNLEQLKKAMPTQTYELFVEGFSELEEISKWTLVGGTALSIHYHHRLSEDLDFFIHHSTLEQSRKRIFMMMQQLENNGFDVVKVKEDERNLDFEIFGVKVTFFASGIDSLKEKSQNYKQIEVASVETIIAMKMDAIINYRTKSRDFFDIYTIAKERDITFFSMLDRYNLYTQTKTKESELLHRLLVRELDGDDEGLSEMKPKKKMSFGQLRSWVKEEVKANGVEETKIINSILSKSSSITQYASRYFGFERMSLLQKLASIYEPKMVLTALKEASFDIGYKSIAGKNILDYYVEDKEMFESLLFYAHMVPDEWLNSRLYRSKGMLPLILLENSLITSIQNESSQERLEKVAQIREVEFDIFMDRLKIKTEYLKKRYL